ncbi:hypothetical protein ACS0TY_013573 [Phlomoides rotata]
MEFYVAPGVRRRTTRFNSKEDSRGGFRNKMEDLLFLTEGGLTRFILGASACRNSSSRQFHVSLSLIEESKNRIRTNDFLDSCSGFPIIQGCFPGNESTGGKLLVFQSGGTQIITTC